MALHTKLSLLAVFPDRIGILKCWFLWKEEKAKKFKSLIAFFLFWYSVNSISDTYQKIPVKSIKIFIQRAEKEEVKCQQENESSEHSYEEEGKMRWAVKRSIKLTKNEGRQQEYLQKKITKVR